MIRTAVESHRPRFPGHEMPQEALPAADRLAVRAISERCNRGCKYLNVSADFASVRNDPLAALKVDGLELASELRSLVGNVSEWYSSQPCKPSKRRCSIAISNHQATEQANPDAGRVSKASAYCARSSGCKLSFGRRPAGGN